jgi:hypothetical protein
MQVAGLNFEHLRREEEAAKQDWEQAVLAVRAANGAVYKAHQRYLQAWKAVAKAKAQHRVIAPSAKKSDTKINV